MSVDNKLVHFTAGAISGMAGSILTCPLDVAKTRMQSSLVETYRPVSKSELNQKFCSNQSMYNTKFPQRLRFMSTVAYSPSRQYEGSIRLITCIRHIIATEGYKALFKGLIPTLIGVAPSRAIYFTAYNHCKKMYSDWISPSTKYEFSAVHLLSAASAGFVCTTSTNPIWMIRTRLQLNNKSGASSSTIQCIRSIYKQHGIRGFYKGLVASYFGISETAIHFVIYEAIRAKIVESRNARLSSQKAAARKSNSGFAGDGSSVGGVLLDGEEDDVFDVDKEAMDVEPTEFLKYMAAAAISKTIATCIAYPHEVARTRLREENSRYKSFVGTIRSVWKEEGHRGLYRGLGTQLIKHIPNTAIVLTTYEAVVYICHKNGFH